MTPLPKTRSPLAPMQFSLRTMFVVMTLNAIACGAAYWSVQSGLFDIMRALVTGDWLPDQP
jgi:hypothetical protein